MLICVLFGKRDKQVATDVVDAEGRKTRWDRWIREGIDHVEAAVEDFHLAEAEVRGVQELTRGGSPEREALVHRTVIALGVSCQRPVDGYDRVRRVNGWVPAGDRAVLSREEELAGTRGATVRNHEPIRRRVEDRSGRRAH